MKNRNLKEDTRKVVKVWFKNLEWMDDYGYGGIGVCHNRPFGNSDVERDILEDVLEITLGLDKYGEEGYTDEQIKYAEDLYKIHTLKFIKDLGEKI